MRHKLRTYTPSFVVAALVVGLATPAFADLPSPNRKRERTVRELEPHHAPPKPEAPPAAEPTPEPTPEPTVTPTPEPKSEVPPSPEPEVKAETKKDGSCSIDDGPEQGALGLGTLVLLIAGVSLRRRRG